MKADYARLWGLLLKYAAGTGSLLGSRSGRSARDSSRHADFSVLIRSSLSDLSSNESRSVRQWPVSITNRSLLLQPTSGLSRFTFLCNAARSLKTSRLREAKDPIASQS